MKYLAKNLLTAVAMTVTSISGLTSAQDNIEIVNPNGEQVKPQAVVSPDNAQQAADVQIDDGEVTIVGPDGQRQGLNFGNGNQSITIRKSFRSVDKDGKLQTENSGQAIIIGPDGKKQVIDLGGDGAADLKIPGLPQWAQGFGGVVQAKPNAGGKFMIGVHCKPLAAALASHLELETNEGIVVAQVSPNSPADVAGIQQHDILLFGDEKQLSSPAELASLVQLAGKDDAEISISLIRGGKELSVAVKPVERPADAMQDLKLNGLNHPAMNLFGDDMDLEFRGFGPGVVFGGDLEQRMMKRMEEMRARMKAFEMQLDLRPVPNSD